MRKGSVLLLSVFFVSGISALLYQIVWLKYLGLIFGNTVYAAATLIAIFLGGLGLGAFIFSRSFVARRPLVVYSCVEALIGTFGAFSPNGFELLNRAYVAAFPSVHGSPVSMTLLRIALAGLFLLPPTILMGGTLPLLVRWFRGATAVSALYAANTLGATAGVALAGFVLIPRIGLLATIFVAVVLNFVLAASVALVPKGVGQALSLCGQAESLSYTFVLVASALMGFAAIADEVFWSRILVLHLGSSVYAYSLMLFAFLVGIGIGSAIIERFIERIDVAKTLGVVEIALAISLALQVHLFAHFSDFLAFLFGVIGGTSPFPTLLTASVIALIVPTALMGAAFPLTVRLYSSRDEARAVGHVYLANTIGSITGSMLAGFFLIRFLGSQNGLFAMCAINLALGAWFLWSADVSSAVGERLARRPVAGRDGQRLRAGRPRSFAIVAALVVIAAFALAKPNEVILNAGIFSDPKQKILLFREDVTATVTLREINPQYLSLELNGVNVAGTSGELIGTQKLQGHIPLLVHANPKRVLHIGFGSGGTAWAVSRHPVDNITIAEISPEVLEVSDSYLGAVNHHVLHDPRVHAEINDGRNYVLATPEKFDVILSDSIHPRYAGNGSLYTRDYFELCRRRLNPGGVISMWLPMYSLTTRNYLQIVRAFRDVFPNTTIWYVPNTPNTFTIVMGRLEDGALPLDRIQAHWTPSVAAELREIGMRAPVDLLPALMLGPRDVARITQDIPPHVDDIPSVEYESGRVLDRNLTWYQTFDLLARNMTPLGPAVDETRRRLISAHLRFAADVVRREHAAR